MYYLTEPGLFAKNRTHNFPLLLESMIKQFLMKKNLQKMLRMFFLGICEYIPNIFLPGIMRFIFFFIRKKRHIGKGTYIDPSVQLIRYGNISIGDYSTISEGGSLNVNHTNNNGYAIIIGNNCYLGHRCFISAGNSVIVKDFAALARDCKLLCSSHIYSDPFMPYIISGTTHNCSIEIGVNCFFGASVIVNGNVKIGHGSVIGANTFINNKDIPPFSVVVGNPAKIIKRYSMASKKWINLDLYTAEDEKNLPTEEEYLESLIKICPKMPMPFHAIGKNFGDLP